jgi:hypothetical protein
MSPFGYTIALCLAAHVRAGLLYRATVETKDIFAAEYEQATYILVITGA